MGVALLPLRLFPEHLIHFMFMLGWTKVNQVLNLFDNSHRSYTHQNHPNIPFYKCSMWTILSFFPRRCGSCAGSVLFSRGWTDANWSRTVTSICSTRTARQVGESTITLAIVEMWEICTSSQFLANGSLTKLDNLLDQVMSPIVKQRYFKNLSKHLTPKTSQNL